jgi:hypothetical protein
MSIIKSITLSILLLLTINAFSQQTVISHKTVDIRNSVYNLLDHYEAKGVLPFLPTERPYTKGMIVYYLTQISESGKLSAKEQVVIDNYQLDFSRPVNGFMFKQHHSDKMYTVLGTAASVGGQLASGDNGTYASTSIFEPYVAGDLGQHISYFAALGLSVERLAPDIFYESYVKNGDVHFPHQNTGYAFHPYMFDYETMWNHVPIDASSGGGGPVQENWTAGMIYHSELSGSFFENAVRFSLHNNRRSWGYAPDNLNLSARARRFPGLDIVIKPNNWLSYSMLVGSLFQYGNQRAGYKENIYGYDLGDVQKMFTYHQIEVTPYRFMQLSITGGNIWSKRFELAYLMPFTFPLFSQIDVGDHDNLTMGFNASFLIPKAGKTWFSVFVDEFSFIDRSQNLLKMPRNRYAWQIGWNTALLSNMVPLTTASLSYTRVTPFVYTHYPETSFNNFTSRPLDYTYTHDGANLGFYLPPNSSEVRYTLTNLAIQNLKLELDNRYIIHGTNDLDGDTYQIFGDVYRHQYGNVHDYPLLDFTNDGIYDYTFFTQLSAEYRMRKGEGLGYYRLIGKAGYSNTRWESNNSGVTAPGSTSMLTVSVGLSVDF